MFLKLANECASKEGASAADVEEYAAHKPASSTVGKCLRACVGETVGIMKNNQVDVEGVKSVTTMAFDGDAAKIEMVTGFAKACVGITDADRCEAIAKILDCGHTAAKDKGISFADL